MDPVSLEASGISQTVEFQRELTLPGDPDTDHLLYVFDTNTDVLFGGSASDKVVISDGEEAKSWESVAKILQAALKMGMTRRSVFVGVGGGVIGDMTAFAASIYMRGCSVVLVPTTLLAMVDAAVGGKTGINFGGYKNMVGSFHPAHRVVTCTEALTSLPEREYHSGLAEVIKTAALGDRELYGMLRDRRDAIFGRDSDVMREVVARCVRVKAEIVEADLTEQGRRAWLNLGHTFAHALESTAGFGAYTHGEAVAWGMSRAMALGRRIDITAPDYARDLVDLIHEFRFSTDLPDLDTDGLIQAMARDKKRQTSRLRFVLQKNLCDTIVTEVDTGDVEAILE
jgi:3-dehydroquinate synthase